jgi:hypothetical protein
MLCASDSFSAVPSASHPVFMFFALGHIFGSPEGVRPYFHVLRSRTRFQRSRGRRAPISCFALPDTVSAIPRASGPVFIFCAPDSFSAVPRASTPVFMFCAPGLIFGSNEGIVSRFHVLRSRARFRRYGGRSVPFSSFAVPNMFSAVPSASGPVFMFCEPGHVFGGPVGDGSRFHVLHVGTCFWRYRKHHVPFSYFALPDTVSAITRASAPIFMFCAPGLVFCGTEGVGSRFHVLCSRSHFRR